MEVNKSTNIFTLDTNERNRELERDLTERNLMEFTAYAWIGASSQLVEHEKEFSKHCKR